MATLTSKVKTIVVELEIDRGVRVDEGCAPRSVRSAWD